MKVILDLMLAPHFILDYYLKDVDHIYFNLHTVYYFTKILISFMILHTTLRPACFPVGRTHFVVLPGADLC